VGLGVGPQPPTPQSPIPNPQSPKFKNDFFPTYKIYIIIL